MKHKFTEIKSSKSTIEYCGYASVFNHTDSYNDVILPGAFSESLDKEIKLLWQHDHKQPIGRVIHMQEDVNGLFIKFELLLNLQNAKEANELIKEAIIDSLSIGYIVKDYFDHDGIRYIKKVDLLEISVVTFPANDKAKILEQKSLIEAISKAHLALKYFK